MALISCPECSKQVSSAAPQCPQCGYPLSKPAEKTPTNSPSPARTTTPTPRSTFPAPIPQQATHIVIHQPAKDHKGLARAGWILIFLVCGVALIPFLGFASWLVATPIFLVTFIISIMVLSRGGTLPGILLLFTSIIVGPVFVACAPFVSSFLGLGAVGKSIRDNERTASVAQKNTNQSLVLGHNTIGNQTESHNAKYRSAPPPLTDYKEALSWNVQRMKLQAGSSWVRLAAKPGMDLQPFTLDPSEADAFQQVRLIVEAANGVRSKEIALAELVTSKTSLRDAAFLYIRSDGRGRHEEIELRAEFAKSNNRESDKQQPDAKEAATLWPASRDAEELARRIQEEKLAKEKRVREEIIKAEEDIRWNVLSELLREGSSLTGTIMNVDTQVHGKLVLRITSRQNRLIFVTAENPENKNEIRILKGEMETVKDKNADADKPGYAAATLKTIDQKAIILHNDNRPKPLMLYFVPGSIELRISGGNTIEGTGRFFAPDGWKNYKLTFATPKRASQERADPDVRRALELTNFGSSGFIVAEG